MHHGNPTAYQKECYTLVLKGQIALALSVFPQKTTGETLHIDKYTESIIYVPNIRKVFGLLCEAEFMAGTYS